MKKCVLPIGRLAGCSLALGEQQGKVGGAEPNSSDAWDMFRQIQSGSSSLGLRQVRRVVIFVVGMTVLLFGLALIVLPGPAFLVVPAGLAILGLEFRWARRWMRRAREMFDTTFSRKRVPAKPETEKRGAVEKIGV